jgi:hypothetical protein
MRRSAASLTAGTLTLGHSDADRGGAVGSFSVSPPESAPHAPIAASRGYFACWLVKLGRPLLRAEALRLSALISVGAGVALAAGRGETFFADDWAFIAGRRSWTAQAFFAPHNEHIAVVPALVYKLLFATVGLAEYWPYRLVGVGLHVLCVLSLYFLVRPRIGSWGALGAASILLFFGPGWEVVLFPFAINFSISLGAGMGMMLALERRTRRSGVTASILLGVSLAASTLGVVFAVIAVVELVLRRRWSWVWVPVAPSIAYLAWYIPYGRASTSHDHVAAHLDATPAYVAHAASTAFMKFFHFPAGQGAVAAILVAAMTVLVVLRSPNVLSPRLVSLCCGILAFWVLLGLGRSDYQPSLSRYIYVAAIFFILIGAELLRSTTLDRRLVPLVVLALVALIAVNLAAGRSGASFLQTKGNQLRAQLGALSATEGYVPTAMKLDPGSPNLTVGVFRESARALGSPADPARAIRQEPEVARLAADTTLLRIARATFPSQSQASRTTAGLAPACTHLARPFGVSGPGPTLMIRGPSIVHARRFADVYPLSALARTRQGWQEIRVPRVRASGVWHLQVTPTSPTGVCVAQQA